MKICASCGAQIEDGMKFCGGCGTPVADAAEAAKEAVGAVNAQAGGFPQQTNAAPATDPAAAGQNYAQPQQQYDQQYNNFQQQAPAAPKQPNPLVEKVKKQPLLLAIPAGALVAIIVAIIIIVNVTKYQKVDAKELFEFKFEGLNNYGTVTGTLNAYPDYVYKESDTALALKSNLKDLKGMDEDLADLLDSMDTTDNKEEISPFLSVDPSVLEKTWTKAKDTKEMISMRKALLKTNSKGNYLIKAKFDKEKNLKNGDKVKVTIECDEEMLKENKIKLTNTSFELEVKNLEEGVEFDPFDEKYLTVSFEGMDGEGYLNISTTSDKLDEVYYDYDYYSGLSNGDKVKVECEAYGLKPAGDAFYFESNGKCYVVKKKADLVKEFEVTGLKELEEIDVFENIAFKFDRGTPFLRVSGVDNDNMNKVVVDNVSFSIDNADSLKVGDKFTVKAYAYSSLSSEGYKVKGESDSDGYYTKEFTVDDTMPSFVDAENARAAYESEDLKDMIADEETEIKTKLQDTSAGWLWNASNVNYKGKVEKVESMVLKDVYVAFTSKNNYSNVSNYVNRVYGLYEIKVKTDDEEENSATLYALIYMDNILTGDGKFYQSSSWDTLDYYFYGTMNDFNKEVVSKEGYTVTKSGGSADVEEEEKKPEETTTTTTTAKEEESKAEETSKEEKEEEKETEKETEKPAEEEPAEETEKAS
ncbi:zinc ribbon domain-containing protein [Ruminococcus sp.]|uniref:zinc ribbon domain-containing protein n=1 Tax=Ruminococcus sp. TaxID=41978 RepID=UPI0025D29521|nr:zinc ribbon domain-containing protein [Ruminococcus sp.]MBQ8967695.1 zinc ribbon domain-containing protein [Ruminococcus sp.]